MDSVILSLGSNLGDREQHLRCAVELLELQDVSVIEASSVYETQPYGIEEQPNFLNQVVAVVTSHGAQELMQICLAVEHDMGRVRGEKNGPRIIDIDVLFYRDEETEQQGLKVPHRGIAERRFVLAPLAEIAAEQIHPSLKKSLRQLLDECPDQLIVKPYTSLREIM